MIRVLLVADTHLGIDLPFRPRVSRRRRGHDFFANFERALQPAFEGGVDLVVHGGDLFYRTRVPAALVEMAMAPLIRVASHGVPVFLVPGNHERSRIPLHLWARHPRLHLFDRPRTYPLLVAGVRVALAGFPFAREVGHQFNSLVKQTGYADQPADVRLLCIHQTVEGAQVGPAGYTFRRGRDVVSARDMPHNLAAVLAGHIHRRQWLNHDLSGNRLGAPVIYPGSIERTSFAERNEDKGYAMIEVAPSGRPGGELTGVSFVTLPARPMVSIGIETDGRSGAELTSQLRTQLAALEADSIVRVVPHGPMHSAALQVLTAANLRALAPASMNIQLSAARAAGADPID